MISYLKIGPIAAVVMLCPILLNSCGPTAKEPPKKEKELPKLVGRIASIHLDQNFVLIQSYGQWKIQAGTILASTGTDGRAANLKVTGEKTGQFAAADIQSGTLEIGDSVFTTISSQVPKTTETP